MTCHRIIYSVKIKKPCNYHGAVVDGDRVAVECPVGQHVPAPACPDLDQPRGSGQSSGLEAVAIDLWAGLRGVPSSGRVFTGDFCRSRGVDFHVVKTSIAGKSFFQARGE